MAAGEPDNAFGETLHLRNQAAKTFTVAFREESGALALQRWGVTTNAVFLGKRGSVWKYSIFAHWLFTVFTSQRLINRPIQSQTIDSMDRTVGHGA